MREILEFIIAFEEELKRNSSIRVVKFDFFNSPANTRQIDELEKSEKIEKTVLDFLWCIRWFWSCCSSLTFHLRSMRCLAELRSTHFSRSFVTGPAPFILMMNLKIVLFANSFRWIFFVTEAAAGFCTLEGYRNKTTFLFLFEENLIPLYVNFESYLKCLLVAKGCLYWQYLIVELLSGKESEMSRRIKQYLPQLFPDFRFQAFEKMFNEVRVRRLVSQTVR